ncbi:protealysin inhibitor emfourin [Microlunatus speluncae]|uniref:protealysin inhibitor emfourin n=1 Tax=Microlunatus speluncae TaxID=2594267 RepID=UPI0012662291|nr:protealysin inhibitor emfourin [Microlunatus speluncae]
MSCDAAPYPSIVPPYLIARLREHPDAHVAECARQTLDVDLELRRFRPPATPAAQSRARPAEAVAEEPGPRREIGDAQNGSEVPGRIVRSEGEPAVEDPAVNEAYDGLGTTWRLFHDVFGRDSLDGAGLPLLATVHYLQDWDNAQWDGTRMMFGDGDGTVFNRFTLALDVIAHELSHGVTQYTANLTYSGQSGALNESVSDVFGAMAKQFAAEQSAEAADWLIGAGLFTDQVQGDALRSMKEPGSAYDDDVLGKDPQPGHMDDFIATTEDNGGVHLNSGIPNRAFYLAATKIGGNSWEGAGPVWYDVLTGDQITTETDFAGFAALTVAAAGARYGDDSDQQRAVAEAWQEVGVPGEEAPPASDPGQITVVRSGGFAGIRLERTGSPAELPEPDAGEWRSVLADPTVWPSARPSAQVADGFVFTVHAPSAGLEISAGEHDYPARIRNLLVRFLDQRP